MFGQVRGALVPTRIVQTFATGALCGFVSVVFAIANATFLFSGPLQADLAVGLGMMLFSCAVFATTIALLTSFPPMFAQMQEVPIAYLAVVGSALTAAGLEPGSVLPTFVALVSTSAVALGATFILVGYFGLGRLVRFVPYPVIAGFLAGVAWLIVAGSAGVVLGEKLALGSTALLGEPAIGLKAALAAGFVTTLLVANQRFKSPLTTPALVFGALVAFFAVVGAVGIPLGALQEAGWLASAPADARLWPPLGAADLDAIRWEVIIEYGPPAAILIPVSLLAVLMNISGMELQAKRDISFNAELRAAGVANLLAGAGGGAPGYQTLSVTLLSMSIGGSRASTLVAAACIVAVLALGAPLLSVMPLPIFASVIMATGISVLYDKLVRSRRALPIGEYLVLIAIFGLTVTAGFVTAVLFGVGAAMALFVADYSRLNVIKLALTGRDYQSHSERSDARRRVLEAFGDSILILRLQGYLFFGSADALKKTIEERLERGGPGAVRFLLLDFRLVSGIDSAAVQSFVRLSQVAERAGCMIVLAHVAPAVLRTLAKGGLDAETSKTFRVSPDLDQALAACEHAVLQAVDPEIDSGAVRPIERQLCDLVGDADHAATMAAYLDRVEIGPASRFIEEGSPANEMYFIEAGNARVRLDSHGGAGVSVVTIGPGAIVGEISFYLGRPRTASVIAEGPVTAWRFSRAQLQELQASAPETAFRFHQGMAAMLAERLTATDRLVRFLAD